MIGERLAELRKDAKLSQEGFAKLMGVSTNTISGYERNIIEPPDDMKRQIARYFDVSLDYLLGERDERLSLKGNRTKLLVLDLPQKALEDLENYIGKLKIKYKL